MPETETRRGVAALFKRPLLAGALAATAIAAPVAADASTDIFLRLDGIPGESTDEKHKDQIEILTFSLGFVNQPAAGGGSSRVACGDVILSKTIDKSSRNLILYTMTGQRIPSGTLAFTVATGKGGNEDYYLLSLTDLVVTAVRQSDAVGGQKVLEQVTLNAAVFKFVYRAQNPADGSFGAPQSFGFDCRQNKAL